MNVRVIKQLVLYLGVGGGATLVEWGVFYLCNCWLNIHYIIATTIAFAFSTLSNWGLGRIFLFKKVSNKGLLFELTSIYLISIIGLLANLIIMYIAIEMLAIMDMMAKIIATAVVFAGNFLVRKFWIYKGVC